MKTPQQAHWRTSTSSNSRGISPKLQKFNFPIDTYQFDPRWTLRTWNPICGESWYTFIHENYDLYHGFVILHGTDTMAYTASALSFMLEGLDKPVILTGSQLPIGVLRTDGKENLMTSIEIAAAQDKEGKHSFRKSASSLRII